jgi:hypothetical protein
MKLLESIVNKQFVEAKEEIYKHLNELFEKKIGEVKKYAAAKMFEQFEELREAKMSSNRIRMGRIVKIRRRIRRNKKGKIVVQRNVRRSALKGFRITGNTVRRIPSIKRIKKARKLKRYWRTKGKARKGRTLLKRRMSLRRRKGMGIR